MNLINPFTNQPETKQECIARLIDQEKTYRASAMRVRGGFRAKFTKSANLIRERIKELEQN
jgi:hypothetical protein